MRLTRHKLILSPFFIGLSLLGLTAIVQGKTQNAPPEVLSNQRITNHFHIYTDLESHSLFPSINLLLPQHSI